MTTFKLLFSRETDLHLFLKVIQYMYNFLCVCYFKEKIQKYLSKTPLETVLRTLVLNNC